MCLFPKDGLRKRQENDVKGQQESVMAQLLRVRREVAVVPFDVGGDPAALAPPLVAVGNKTGEMVEGDVCPHLFYMMASHCDPDRVGEGLPGLDVLRHDAPRQVIVAVVPPRVVKEVGPRREDVSGKSRGALWGKRRKLAQHR